MSVRVFLVLLVLHGLVDVAFLHGVGLGFPLDDTWLHMVYARAFGTGEGFAYNPGQFETGVTAPLWTALLSLPVALSELAGWRPDLGARLLGAICGLGLACEGYRLAARAGRWPAVFVALALTFDPLLLVDRFSGMELPLFGWLTLVLVGGLLDGREARVGLMSGALVLTRPEGLLVALLALVWIARHRMRITSFLWPLLICVLPWMGYCLVASGRPWPSTVENKLVAVLAPGAAWTSLGALLGDSGWRWALPLAAVVGVFSLEGGCRQLGMVVGLVGLALLVGVVLTRELPVHGDPPRVPYYWRRYAQLAWAPLVFVGSAGLAALVRTAYAGTRCRPFYATILIGPLLVVLVAGRALPGQGLALRERFADECAELESMHVAAGRWLAENLDQGSVVATHDAGALRYFGGHPVIDIWGNHNNELLAIERRRGPAAAAEWLVAQRPDALVVFPAIYAAGHSPELLALARKLPAAEYAALSRSVSDYAQLLGLTRRAETFHVDEPTTVPSPLHADLAIFLRP